MKSRIAVIVPVYNGGATLRHCLAAITVSARAPDEVIVVDDGSTDGAVDELDPAGFTLLAVAGGPHGPARARNLGARAAGDADILVFVDADVAVHADAIGLLVAQLESNPEIAAAFGSYDDRPPARDTVSLYKNLLHHHTHQRGAAEAATFWAGCGAIKREIFDQLGGFDEGYAAPSIEDIELGTRLRAAGHRIRLCREALCTHYKKWTFVNLLRTDIFARALPWSRLLMKQQGLLNDLNISTSQRLAALGAIGLTISTLSAGLAPAGSAIFAALSAILFVWPNIDLFRLFHHTGGVRQLVGGAGLHWLYYLYSSTVFVWVRLTSIGRGPVVTDG